MSSGTVTEPAILETTSDWAVQTRIADVSTDALAGAKLAILDSIGMALAARPTAVSISLARYLDSFGAPGDATVLGLGRTTNVENAVFANATLTHALDYDDISRPLAGHPSAPVLPVALALCELGDLSGADLLLAYCIGTEIEIAIGAALNFTHTDNGWHPTATIGTFGAAAAACKVLGLDAEATAHALSLATASAAGIKASFGTMAKAYQVGRAAQSGLLCARAAASGFTGSLGAFDERYGFANVYNGGKGIQLDAITGSLGNPWSFDVPGLVFKRYPCCGGVQAAIDAALEVNAANGGFLAGEIERVEAYIHPTRLGYLDRPDPGSAMDAQYSLQYCVALALREGQVGPSAFTPEGMNNQEVRDLSLLVEARAMPEEKWGPGRSAAAVSVFRSDGSVLEAHLENPRPMGHGTGKPAQDVVAKFQACTEAMLTGHVQEEIVETVLHLEEVSSARLLIDRLASVA